ncbi:MAG: CARDB domain-containing protein [Anaerobutyricum soehngenii]
MPDADASITVPVKNNGLTNCGEGKVQIVYNGNVIGQADLENGITSGETQDVTMNILYRGCGSEKH